MDKNRALQGKIGIAISHFRMFNGRYPLEHCCPKTNFGVHGITNPSIDGAFPLGNGPKVWYCYSQMAPRQRSAEKNGPPWNGTWVVQTLTIITMGFPWLSGTYRNNQKHLNSSVYDFLKFHLKKSYIIFPHDIPIICLLISHWYPAFINYLEDHLTY